MNKKYFIVSAVLLVLTIILMILGIALFNILPNADASGYMDTKSALMATGCFFLFIFAVVSLGGTIITFVLGIFNE